MVPTLSRGHYLYPDTAPSVRNLLVGGEGLRALPVLVDIAPRYDPIPVAASVRKRVY